MTDAQPIFVRGNDIGCLLIHGFSGRPEELRSLADAMIERGYTVSMPVLPGHGSTRLAMRDAGWRDWFAAVTAAHAALRATCDTIVIVGHSMGGALAVAEAAQHPPAALVLIGMPTFIGDWRVRFIPVIKYAMRWWYPLSDAALDEPGVQERVRRHAPDADLRDPAVRRAVRENARIPMHAVDHFLRLTRYARKRIRTITTPALVVHGRNDTVAVPICAEETYRDLASPDKRLVWIESGHHVFASSHSDEVVHEIMTWLAERLTGSGQSAAGSRQDGEWAVGNEQ